jgi:hypothetical protein
MRDDGDRSDDGNPANRRRFLKAVGALGVAGLAGCASDGGPTPTATDEPAETPTETPGPTGTPGSTESSAGTPTGTESTTPTESPCSGVTLDDPPSILTFDDGEPSVTPGESTTLTGEITNPFSRFPLETVAVTLTAPSDGWTVSPSGATTIEDLAGLTSESVAWDVSPPDSANESTTLTADVSYSACDAQAETSVDTSVYVIPGVPDERIERIHQPQKTLAGAWSYESSGHASALRELLGKQAYVLEFDHWYGTGQPPAARLFGAEQGPGAYANITDAGFVPHVIWLGPKAGVEQGNFTEYATDGEKSGEWHADVATGEFDEGLRRMARRVADVSEPFFFVPYARFTGDVRPSYDLSTNSAEAFVESWRRMWKIFQQEGATNAAWVIVPETNFVDVDRGGPRGIDNWWPGDTYVDYVGYYLTATSDTTDPASTVIQQALSRFNSVTEEQKPFLMNLIGIDPDYTDADMSMTPSEYAREALRYMRDEPQVVGFEWGDFSGTTGVTQSQSYGTPPETLTDVGTALREEINNDAFVEEPSYSRQSMPDFEPL